MKRNEDKATHTFASLVESKTASFLCDTIDKMYINMGEEIQKQNKSKKKREEKIPSKGRGETLLIDELLVSAPRKLYMMMIKTKCVQCSSVSRYYREKCFVDFVVMRRV